MNRGSEESAAPPEHGAASLSADRIEEAYHGIDPVFRDTPQFISDALSGRLGVRALVKVETVNPIRSFKGRGTDHFTRTLAPRPERVVCASAGNFGQGLAYCGTRRGIGVDVFTSTVTSPLKVERMRGFGATVHQAGEDFDAAKEAARAHASRYGIPFVEDGREPAITEGAGTIGLELCRWPEPIETVVVPLGNGALLGGIACWLRDRAPDVRIIGVCAARAPAMERSWRTGTVIETDSAETIADGIAVRVPVPEALDRLRGLLDDVVLVEEEMIVAAMRLTFDTLGLVVEAAGAVGVAALMADPDRFRSGLVATPLCGGNLTPRQIREWLTSPETEETRARS